MESKLIFQLCQITAESEQVLNDVGWIARAWEWVRACMDVGNGIALIAALIALVALWFAQRSAKASEDSASAAVRSAAASEETVRLAKAARDRNDRPRFEFSARHLRNELCQVTIKMIDGPPQIEVSADYIAESESRDIPIPDGSGYARAVNLTAGSSNERVLLVKNDAMVMAVKVQPDAVAGTVQVTVLCDETDGERRQWYDVESIRWSRPTTTTTRARPKITLGPGIGTTSKRVVDPRTAEPDVGSDATLSTNPDDD
jgi:hypothetical protein